MFGVVAQAIAKRKKILEVILGLLHLKDDPMGVFAKIDKMLPIIREPRATNWNVTIADSL